MRDQLRDASALSASISCVGNSPGRSNPTEATRCYMRDEARSNGLYRSPIGCLANNDDPQRITDGVRVDEAIGSQLATASSVGGGPQDCRPSTEILRMFHQAFPNGRPRLSENYQNHPCPSTSHCYLSYETSCQSVTRYDTSDLEIRCARSPGETRTSSIDGLMLEPSCWMVAIDDVSSWEDLAEQQHDEYEVKPRKEHGMLCGRRMSGLACVCAPAA